MQVNFEKTSSTLGTLTVNIVEADYKPGVEKKLKEYAKTAHVKGFRPGHVPFQYIKNVYGKGVLVDEVIRVASQAVDNTIKENKLNVVGEPIPSDDSYNIDWTKQSEYNFTYSLGFASDFTIDVEKLPEVTQYDITPGADTLAKTIEDIIQRYPKEIEPETVALGDIVFGTLTQESSEFTFQSGIPTDKVKESSQNIFLGLSKGSTVKFDIQSIFENVKELGFATGKSDEDAAALEGEYNYEVTKISRSEKAELNQEFYDKVLGPGKATDQASFETQLTEIISDNYKREADFLLNFEVEEALLENYKIELPDAFVKEWLLEINKGKVTEEQVDTEYPMIAKGLKLDFIKAEIAKQLEVKVDFSDVKEEVKAEIRGYFGGQGFEGMEDFIDSMAEKQLKEKKTEETRKYLDKAFGKKVIEATKAKMQKNMKNINVEEFNDIAKAKYDIKD